MTVNQSKLLYVVPRVVSIQFDRNFQTSFLHSKYRGFTFVKVKPALDQQNQTTTPREIVINNSW